MHVEAIGLLEALALARGNRTCYTRPAERVDLTNRQRIANSECPEALTGSAWIRTRQSAYPAQPDLGKATKPSSRDNQLVHGVSDTQRTFCSRPRRRILG